LSGRRCAWPPGPRRETHKLADLTRLISRESAPGRKLREDAAEKVPA
jgi:hypothetical protein